jgi:uncharacterized lipoprotein YmbA
MIRLFLAAAALLLCSCGSTLSFSKTYQPKDKDGNPVGLPIKFTLFVEDVGGILTTNQK